MEHVAQEDWAGHADRTRECLRTLVKYQYPSGAIPDMHPNCGVRRDWGGSNHYFFREVDHYLAHTGDLEFIAEIEEAMERVLAQSFREYDPKRGGVLMFYTQIGNQEDFESIPGPGAAPGGEGVNMLRVMARVKQALNKYDEAERLNRLADSCLSEMKRRLWQQDLGRFAWYEDDKGCLRPDGGYHAYANPLIYGYLDPIDAQSAADHMLNRMTGPEGEIYLANHFSNHRYENGGTWGMQCGTNMQAFASMAYAAIGLNSEAIRPMQFVANRVCDGFNRGSWPETANEKSFAYFSPSAAVFAQAMIEGIFGLTPDALDNKLTVKPCLPAEWNRASLKVHGVSLEYIKNDSIYTFNI